MFRLRHLTLYVVLAALVTVVLAGCRGPEAAMPPGTNSTATLTFPTIDYK
jgi:hypothetical protein